MSRDSEISKDFSLIYGYILIFYGGGGEALDLVIHRWLTLVHCFITTATDKTRGSLCQAGCRLPYECAPIKRSIPLLLPHPIAQDRSVP